MAVARSTNAQSSCSFSRSSSTIISPTCSSPVSSLEAPASSFTTHTRKLPVLS